MTNMTVITVPGILVQNRKIFIEGGVVDPEGQKIAVMLGEIMKERLFNKKAGNEPLIKPVTIGVPG